MSLIERFRRGFSEISKEDQRIAEGVGPLETPEQKESDQLNSEGWELHTKGKFEEAIVCFDNAIKLNPRHALSSNNKGLSLRRLRRMDEALKCFEKAIETAPQFVKPYSNMGETFGMMGNFPESAKWYHKALEIEPGYSRAVEGLRLYSGIEITSEESDRVKKLIDKNPVVARLITEGGLLIGIAKYVEALEKYEEALKLLPNNPEILSFKAECLVNLGYIDEASKFAEKSTKLDPTFASAWVTRSLIHMAQEDLGECIRCAQKAIEIDPTEDMAWNNIGSSLMLLGRYSEAVENFDQALSVNPINPKAKVGKEACLRRTEPIEHLIFGSEELDLVEVSLKAGKRIAIAFNFSDSRVDWKRIFVLANRYDKFVVTNTLEKSVEETKATSDRFFEMGQHRLGLDVLLLAKELERTN